MKCSQLRTKSIMTALPKEKRSVVRAGVSLFRTASAGALKTNAVWSGCSHRATGAGEAVGEAVTGEAAAGEAAAGEAAAGEAAPMAAAVGGDAPGE